mgnify:CR=1 FL=1|tara:strand:- start:85 stop:459 length:375 start_codon:yes stop_codon:yes gene_type:complete
MSRAKYRAKYSRSQLSSVEITEGEPIEHKIERVVSNKEPITDGAPSIFTERKDGVVSAYNIRTDRWEVATEAMDKVSGSIQAKRDAKGKVSKPKEESKSETKVVDLKVDNVSEAKSTEGGKKAN